LIAVINAMLAAVIGALVVVQLRQATWVMVVVGSVVFLVVLGTLASVGIREFMTLRDRLDVRFPRPK
jgi:hypothetical protein